MEKNTINSIVSQSTFVTGLRTRERTALPPQYSFLLSGDSSPTPTCFLLSFRLFGNMSILQTQFRKPHFPTWVRLLQPFLWTSLKFHAAQFSIKLFLIFAIRKCIKARARSNISPRKGEGHIILNKSLLIKQYWDIPLVFYRYWDAFCLRSLVVRKINGLHVLLFYLYNLYVIEILCSTFYKNRITWYQLPVEMFFKISCIQNTYIKHILYQQHDSKWWYQKSLYGPWNPLSSMNWDIKFSFLSFMHSAPALQPYEHVNIAGWETFKNVLLVIYKYKWRMWDPVW